MTTGPSLIIKNAKILNDSNQFLIRDVHIENGLIKNIAENISSKDPEQLEILDAKKHFLSPGFIDMHVHLRDPGFTEKEDIKSGSLAAAAGGFTRIACMPNTNPATDNPRTIQYIQNHAKKNKLVNISPMGAITQGQKGAQLADLEMMRKAGVIGFSDDGFGVENEQLMLEAMKLAHSLNMPIIAHCEAREYLPENTRMAEIDQLRRDIKLATKSGVQYHACHLSCKESIQLVREAKSKGIKISCEVTPHHILLQQTEQSLQDSNYKMNPPLRKIADNQAIIEGLLDGTIDMIATDHAPHTEKEKSQKYENAPNGVIGLETTFPLLYTHLVLTNKIELHQLIKLMAYNPAKVFSLPENSIKIGNSADLTLINLDSEKIVSSDHFFSKAKNTPFNGERLKGWPMATIVGGKLIWNR